jgi:hypothetical protein
LKSGKTTAFCQASKKATGRKTHAFASPASRRSSGSFYDGLSGPKGFKFVSDAVTSDEVLKLHLYWDRQTQKFVLVTPQDFKDKCRWEMEQKIVTVFRKIYRDGPQGWDFMKALISTPQGNKYIKDLLTSYNIPLDQLDDDSEWNYEQDYDFYSRYHNDVYGSFSDYADLEVPWSAFDSRTNPAAKQLRRKFESIYNHPFGWNYKEICRENVILSVDTRKALQVFITEEYWHDYVLQTILSVYLLLTLLQQNPHMFKHVI